MSVLDRFSRPLLQEQKARGELLLKDGGVDVQSPSAGALAGSVLDDDYRFETVIKWSPDRPWACFCPCIVAKTGTVCAHCIATILAAEQSGLIQSEQHAVAETRPRRGNQPARFLSSSGQVRRLDDVDEPRPIIHHQPSAPSWKKQLTRLRDTVAPIAPSNGWPADRAILYVVDIPSSLDSRSLVIRLACRDRRSSGEWSRPRTRGISFPDVPAMTDVEDQQIVALLKSAGGRQELQLTYDPIYRIPAGAQRLLMRLISRTGRTMVAAEPESEDLRPLVFDDGLPYEFWVECRPDETEQQYVLTGWLRRGEERIPLSRPLLFLAGGLVFFDDKAALLEDGGAYQWMLLLRQQKTIVVPFAQGDELLTEMLSIPNLPRLDLPDNLRVETVRVEPTPHLRIRSPGRDEFRPERLRAELAADYAGKLIRYGSETARNVFDDSRRRLIVRDVEGEQKLAERLRKMGLREAFDYSRGGPEFWFNRRHLPRIIRMLVQEGWQVEADDKLYRRAGRMRLHVASGIDWFELRGDVDFDGRSARLPDLLAALRRGENTVRLDDGTFGMLPESWLKKYGLLAALGTEEEDFLKFSKTQVGVLDALLASQPDVTCDELFERTRSELHRFEGIEAIAAPAGFIGELRAYQSEGLGWFAFLEKFGFGGCLADDMGLGKTVQVLALLESRRAAQGKDKSPSLVVVPRSLVFNWQQESARFTPKLRLLDHTGIDRIKSGDHLSDYDLVITTYGTLRRDAAFLKDVEFDYVILDEAQAVKNPASESAKAVRLVNGRHRLALSGTPVQNHLGDLWSLFDFLNPGMLGSATVFNGGGANIRNPDADARSVLARAVRPFILRRTKEQVAADLPAKLEQTIYCELEPAQRKLYDDLREHYRRALLERIDRDGLNKSKIQILEALLRLRQASLHPGLLDKSRSGEPSAKLDMLIPRLAEVIDEGHKALVFSQFTSMLAIVREALARENIVYEYLDGKTKDRAAHVERFQNDPDCKLFLISLKAGGLGLNLTAADYVFLLDPWWNPAVEAQAIDRAHRIGQTKQVYACRLIAKDTVEEKVLALQKTKRDLADAIITADNSLIGGLGREDLELLLS